jgi:hypothetical protein
MGAEQYRMGIPGPGRVAIGRSLDPRTCRSVVDGGDGAAGPRRTKKSRQAAEFFFTKCSPDRRAAPLGHGLSAALTPEK